LGLPRTAIRCNATIKSAILGATVHKILVVVYYPVFILNQLKTFNFFEIPLGSLNLRSDQS
jgi:hypothetical protein